MIVEREITVPVIGVDGSEKGEVKLPPLFSAPIRKDLIRRAYLAEYTSRLQPKGRDPMAGKRTSARSLGVGRGLARIPRISGTIRGALVNSTVGGRLAHPPRVEKKIAEDINKKEKVLATASAIAATAVPELVRERGHVFETEHLPIVIEDDVLKSIKRTRDAREFLSKIGVLPDVMRAEKGKRIRAGKGKMRGRRYIVPKSVLFVLESTETPLAKALRNIPGIDIATPQKLSVLDLAPGGVPGRLTVYTPSSLELLWERFKNKLVIMK